MTKICVHPLKIGLVDYEGDSDEDDTEDREDTSASSEEHEKLEPVAKRPRLS